MTLQQILTEKIQKAVQDLFDVTLDKVEFQATRREFEGDITVVIFPLLKLIKSNPVELGNKIGDYLVQNVAEVERFNVVSGFLNLVISDAYYLNFFNGIKSTENFGFVMPKEGDKAVMVEYSSPNTNKPLHLGHVRNNLLGYSVAEILKASGKKVYKTQIINDRGIHICKSMLAWQKFGNGETPATSGLKGDKLVGKYYVEFDKAYKAQINELIAQGKSEDEAKKQAPVMLEAQEMLRQWEAGNEEVVALWKTMNQWVYDGFSETYKNLGVDFDSYYYESNTYLLGKEVVQFGLEKGIFEKDPDGSVWIDLTAEGLDRKIVLRSDGTAVYMTQDIGTAIQRVKDNPDVGGMVYTVGNEQDYHFKVLFLILKKLGFDWAESLYHLSYGMVELPSGKMKSREGTVVDADDLMEEMTATAQSISEELGKLDGYTDAEKAELYKVIGLGALKYFMLKVDPKKNMMFNPEESVDFAGNTGPFIQYTYARIQSILRKTDFDLSKDVTIDLHEKEKELLKQVELFPSVIQDAAKNHSPALIANYTYDLVKEYNSFYQSVSILGEEDENKKIFRVQLSKKVGEVIKSAFGLLGIAVPERM
ncbi:arginine--tRNA ligase [Flavobacterium suncheonense]|uniref:Arginine--tRNA ligase n=1 Tax=Flavobacterium suncheonense GH29-5 = DSM 17707 TaxID=1121899 RepID=A0A0A2MC84_9FLAO|nr:arginine--tRNA ligase [Flavobacterium suncheonense]KGO90277.1 arginyl-tRNA synthetase [Flavobacterium suncheonense GH29-5 = DSM 17707]